MFKLCFNFEKIYAVCLKYSKLKELIMQSLGLHLIRFVKTFTVFENIKSFYHANFVHLISSLIKVISIMYYVFSLNSIDRRHVLLMMTVYLFLLLLFL